jgi:luciferase family oxidoreductase group 1
VSVRLSIADLSQVPPGESVGAAMAGTVELAVTADRLGYHRYWVAEHHGLGHAVAGSTPEVLVARLAAATATLRVGSGGVLLNYAAPLRVAEAFSVLAALFPGRVDLGIGRADALPPVHEALAASAEVNDDPGPANHQFGGMLAAFAHEDRVTELLGWLAGSPGHPEVSIGSRPVAGAAAPQPWLLGSSPTSALLAGRLGLRYCFAAFIDPAAAKLSLDAYRGSFRATGDGIGPDGPHAMVAVNLCCADTDGEADRLRASVELFYGEDLAPGALHRPLQAPEAAVARLGAVPPPTLPGAALRARHLSGGPARVRDLLEHLVAETGVEEVIVQDLIADPGDRRHSYRLLAEALALAADPALSGV